MTVVATMLVPDRRQHGVALITMLLVFAVVAVVAGQMLRDQLLATRRAEALLSDSQIRRFVEGGELLARQWLYRDWRADKAAAVRVDTRAEAWARAPAPYQPEGGELALAITDAESRFNLNNLVAVDGAVDDAQLAVFLRLLAGMGVEDGRARLLASAIVDWIDRDQDVSGDNSEDQGYLQREVPYRTADQGFRHISELQAIAGMSPDLYRQLAPRVVALPGSTAININTVDAVVLAAVMPGLAVEQAAKARDAHGGFATVETFLRDPVTAGVAVPKVPLTVTSSYFLAVVSVQWRERRQRWLTLLQRTGNAGALQVLMREQLPIWEVDTDIRDGESRA